MAKKKLTVGKMYGLRIFDKPNAETKAFMKSLKTGMIGTINGLYYYKKGDQK